MARASARTPSSAAGRVFAVQRLGHARLCRRGELGDVRARQMVGLMYATGQGAPVDQDKAERHWRAASAAGEVQALHDLGTLFAYHKGNLPEAASWYLLAAKAGIEMAWRRKAAGHLGRGRRSDRPAHARLPVQHGIGAKQDDIRAAALYQAAAEAGDAVAAFNLGVLSVALQGRCTGCAWPPRPGSPRRTRGWVTGSASVTWTRRLCSGTCGAPRRATRAARSRRPAGAATDSAGRSTLCRHFGGTWPCWMSAVATASTKRDPSSPAVTVRCPAGPAFMRMSVQRRGGGERGYG